MVVAARRAPSSPSASASTTASTTASTASTTASAPAAKVPKFLRSLYAILQTEDRSIVAWVQNQELVPNRLTAFHILDMARFEREILPKYFKHQKFASFQRQLNNFGFRKWTKTQSSGVCTFSHNCFPPDAARAAVRDHWRMRSPLPNAPIDGSAPPRRIVGNGITKADRKKQQRLAKLSAAADACSSPAASAAASLSHQPTTKRLARPGDLAGLEAFCDDDIKQQPTPTAFVLPPLPAHALITPRTSGFLLSALGLPPQHEVDAAPVGSFRHSLMGFKPLDEVAKPPVTPFAPSDATMTGAFLEPWMWDTHAPGMDLGAIPMEMNWQDSALPSPRLMQTQPTTLHQPLRHHLLHLHDRPSASGVEDLGLDTLLFVE